MVRLVYCMSAWSLAGRLLHTLRTHHSLSPLPYGERKSVVAEDPLP